MIALTSAARIYLYRTPCDMRKSFNGLCGLIRSELDADPLSGSLFVFVKRRRVLLGSDQAILLIFSQYRSNSACFEALEGHFRR